MMVQPDFTMRLSSAAARIESSAIRDLLTITERPEVVSLAGGLPAPEAFPVSAVAAATAAVLADDPACLQYSTTDGFPPLRAWAAAALFADAEADDVVVTHGSQQGLDLLARALIDPGDVAVMADPGYVGAVQALRLAGASLVGIPSDDAGLCVDVLADALARPGGVRPSLVYVVPDFPNPAGASLSLERRRALAALAEHYGFVIVEDNPYGALRWAGTALPPIASFTDQVASLRTVSKTVCPGLRVGFVAGPPALHDAVVLLKQAVDLHTSTLAQRVVYRVVTTPGFMDAHLAELRPLYEARAQALSAALHDAFGERVSFVEPEGGMFVWARLADAGIDTHALLGRAVDHGVAYVPGRAFAVGSQHERELRLSFATATPDELREGVRRLAAAFAA
jgi:2-aminoadipate transaminase